MSNVFKLDIVNPEKSFLSKEDVTEVVVPAFEGDMGILKDHISIISFLKPGLLRVIGPAASEEIYYVEDDLSEIDATGGLSLILELYESAICSFVKGCL